MPDEASLSKYVEGGGLFAVNTPADAPAASKALSGLIGGIRHRATDRTEITLGIGEQEIITHQEDGTGKYLENYFTAHNDASKGIGRVLRSNLLNGSNPNKAQVGDTAYINIQDDNFALYSLGRFDYPVIFDSKMDTKQRLLGGQVANKVYQMSKSYDRPLEDTLLDVLNIYEGPFSLVALTNNSVIAARGSGHHQLVEGRIDDNIFFASEFPSLDILGVKTKDQRELQPGEVVISNQEGIKSYYFDPKNIAICLREYIDFSRDDNFVENIGVYRARVRLGEELAKLYPAPEADIVMGVPSMGVPIAEGFSKASNITFGTGIILNRYREQTKRPISVEDHEQRVKANFNVILEEVRDKSVVLVDNRISSGATIKYISQMLRGGGDGAREVHLRIASPLNKIDCPFGQSAEKSQNGLDLNLFDSVGILSKTDIIRAIGTKFDGRSCTTCMDV